LPHRICRIAGAALAMVAALLIAIDTVGIAAQSPLYASLPNARDGSPGESDVASNANALLAAADEAVPAFRDRQTH
jgi:hypothetical protein